MSRLKTIIDANIKENGNQEITGKTMNYVLTEIANDVNTDGYFPNMSVGFADNLVGRGESVPAEFTFRATGGKSIKDGAARIKRIKGNSVVWNQLLGDAKWSVQFNNNVINKSKDGATFVISYDDFVSIEGGETAHTVITQNQITFFANHVYLFLADAQGQYIQKVDCGVYDGIDYQFIGKGVASSHSCIYFHRFNTTFVSYHLRFDMAMSESDYAKANTIRITPRVIDLTQMFGAGNEPTTIEEFYSLAPSGIDLFAYNGGQVIHMNTESIKSVGDNAWDEQWEQGAIESDGSINSGADRRTTSYIRVLPNEEYFLACPDSAGFGRYAYYDANYTPIKVEITEGYLANKTFTTPSGASYLRITLGSGYGTTYNHDILISLYHSGWKAQKDDQYQPYWEDSLPLPIIRKYFPDGMKSAGSAHDEIRFNKASGKSEKVVRIGSVDLGSLDWNYSQGVFITYISSMNGVANQNTAIMARYSASSSVYGEELYNNVEDKVYKTNGGATGGVASLAISDSSYTDAESFKVAMQGVMLYYELAEPVIREIDEPIGTDYRVADFGTEQAISSVPSAPFSADIIYQFNAVDMIRELWLKVQELESRVAQL